MSAVVFVLGSYCLNIVRFTYNFYNSGLSLGECIRLLSVEHSRSALLNMSTESLSSCEFAYKDFDMIRTATPEVSLQSEVICSCTFPELQTGNCFIVSGSVLKHCERFSINLVCGNSKQDIALHFNPRLPQNYVVRNSRISGSWQKEEVSSEYPFELFRGKKFTVEILVTETEYLLGVNGKHFGKFSHRVPFKKVNSIEVKGDVTDIEIDQAHLDNYPQVIPANILAVNNNSDNNSNKEYMKVPYYGRLTEQFTAGKTLYIEGRIKMLPHSFTVNLQQSTYIWPHPIIPLHFNPRFGNQGGKHIICRNTWVNNKWGKEERTDTQSVFLPGKSFVLTIECQEQGYQIYVDGKLFAEYVFRCDVKFVTTVCIFGDVKLKNVYMLSKAD